MDAAGSLGSLDLLDWRRRIAALYAAVRADPDPHHAWRRWRRERDEMFTTHPQSPLPRSRRVHFSGLDYYDYDPGARVEAEVSPTEPDTYEIATSTGQGYSFTRVAIARFEIKGTAMSLEVYWLEGYGGGVFVPFRDATSGHSTYGAGRYLLDTIKGADLGGEDGCLLFDFNFSYNPSCAYDQRWACPLAPPPNRIEFAIEAGERVPAND